MNHSLTLSVVDQSPMREGSTAGIALRETIDLAIAVEALGYQRYWVAEHHSLPNFAGTSPEMLKSCLQSQLCIKWMKLALS